MVQLPGGPRSMGDQICGDRQLSPGPVLASAPPDTVDAVTELKPIENIAQRGRCPDPREFHDLVQPVIDAVMPPGIVAPGAEWRAGRLGRSGGRRRYPGWFCIQTPSGLYRTGRREGDKTSHTKTVLVAHMA